MRRRILAAVLWIFVGFTCAGCSATELEDRNFPMMAAVDYEEGQVFFSYGFPQLSQKDDTDLQEAKVNAPMAAGNDFAESVRAFEQEMNKLADCNHMKVLVLGENLLREKGKYEEMLSYLKETELFPRNTYVCVVKDVHELFDIEENLPEDLGSYLESYLQNHESDRQLTRMNLGKLLDEKENQKEVVLLPYLEIEDGAVLWNKNWNPEKSD